jgi:hypothetical protein
LGPIFKDRLGFPLDVVEQQKEISEGIRDSIGATMLHEGCKHFKASTMELAPFVPEEKPESTIPNCKTQLSFPHPACLLIAEIGGQGFIGVACGELKHAEIKLDLLQ